ncbi:MAG: hypothetical protein V3T86_17445 [Planctomycetota bacterium]
MIAVLVVLATAVHAGGKDESAKQWSKPKRVTFAHKQVALSAVLKDFQTRFGEAAGLQELKGDRLVDLETKNVTFYEALDQLAENNGLVVLFDKRDKLALTARFKGMPEPQVAHLGPTRLSVEQALRTKDWNGSEFLKVELRWLGPPGMTCALIDLKLNRVSDDEGKVHRLIEEDRYEGFPVVPNRKFKLNFTAPSRTAKKIVSLSGSVIVGFAAKYETVTFKKKELGKTKRLGQSAISLQALDRSPAKVHFTVMGWSCAKFRGGDLDHPRIHFQTKGDTSWDPMKPGLADFGFSCFTKDKSGIGHSGDTKFSTTMGEPTWTHAIGVAQVPERIVFRGVTKLKTKEVRFSFPNVPLE